MPQVSFAGLANPRRDEIATHFYSIEGASRSPNRARVLLEICRLYYFAADESKRFCSAFLTTIARNLAISVDTVERAVKWLVQHGFIEYKRLGSVFWKRHRLVPVFTFLDDNPKNFCGPDAVVTSGVAEVKTQVTEVIEKDSYTESYKDLSHPDARVNRSLDSDRQEQIQKNSKTTDPEERVFSESRPEPQAERPKRKATQAETTERNQPERSVPRPVKRPERPAPEPEVKAKAIPSQPNPVADKLPAPPVKQSIQKVDPEVKRQAELCRQHAAIVRAGGLSAITARSLHEAAPALYEFVLAHVQRIRESYRNPGDRRTDYEVVDCFISHWRKHPHKLWETLRACGDEAARHVDSFLRDYEFRRGRASLEDAACTCEGAIKDFRKVCLLLQYSPERLSVDVKMAAIEFGGWLERARERIDRQIGPARSVRLASATI